MELADKILGVWTFVAVLVFLLAMALHALGVGTRFWARFGRPREADMASRARDERQFFGVTGTEALREHAEQDD